MSISKQIMAYAIVCLFLSSATSCNERNSKHGTNLLNNCPVTGTIEQIGEERFISSDQRLLKDTINIPLSMLTEELEIIRLDNRDEALVSPGNTTPSENYLLVWGKQQNPFKLFDRKGNFITAIGSYGQGPGEYQMVYDAQLDEKNNRIYLLPWQSEHLLVFDLKGNILPSIPLGTRVPKGKFIVDQANQTIAVVTLPFPGTPAVAWTQDFEGNRKSTIEPGHLSVPWDFSNEVCTYRNKGDFDVNILTIMPARVDSLYRYDYKNNKLMPTFTLKFIEDPIPWHGYIELPNHFMGDASYPVQISQTNWESSPPANYIIEKETAKGAYFHLFNDYLGNINIEYPLYVFSEGYYITNMEPGDLLEVLEKAITSSNDSETKDKLTKLTQSIDANDNNIVLLAKLRQ